MRRPRPSGCDSIDRSHGLFLEFDRGTMRRRDYAHKLAAYYRDRNRGLYARDYAGYPAILIVTTVAAQERIAAAARAAGAGRESALPIILTTCELLDRGAQGFPGPIWRETASGGRRYWLRC